jgi:hypothetical protein
MDCHHLTRFQWKGCEQKDEWLDGRFSLGLRAHLTELCLDDARYAFCKEGEIQLSSDATNYHERYVFAKCAHLERLSIKNLTWSASDDARDLRPLSQDMLIKMVRRHPALRWLRSDLTAANIAMLQRERPEITFVSE